jgi:GT2 family glycosyltransferase
VGPDGKTAHPHFGRPKDSVMVEKQQAVEGSCMYIKREVLQKVGMFDEIYGMGYREEVDLAFRAREAGYQVVSSPEAEYIHLVSQTNGPLGITNDTFEIFMSRWGTKLKQGKV